LSLIVSFSIPAISAIVFALISGLFMLLTITSILPLKGISSEAKIRAISLNVLSFE